MPHDDSLVSLGRLNAAAHRVLADVTCTTSAATRGVLEGVLRSEHPLSVHTLSEATALTPRRVRTILGRLKQRGLVTQSARGLYERHPLTNITYGFTLEAER